ncbi:CNN1 isoform 10, partial [Pan troglodytes]
MGTQDWAKKRQRWGRERQRSRGDKRERDIQTCKGWGLRQRQAPTPNQRQSPGAEDLGDTDRQRCMTSTPLQASTQGHLLRPPSSLPELAQKYDHQREQELREWIEGVTGRRIGNNFMDGL